MNKKNISTFFVFTLGCEFVGGLSGLITSAGVSGWYQTLVKAPLNPPSWVFGPVWTILYFLMGIAAFLVWQKRDRDPHSLFALTVFTIQLALNFLWSIVFFSLHDPLLAFFNILALWAAVLWSIVLFWKVSRGAAYLLVPYIIWISFAGYLNFMVYLLN